MANISVRLNEQEEELFKTYAEFMDETLSTLCKKALLEKIEDEFDLKVGTAYACIGKDIMPTEERGSIGQIKPTGWHTVKYDCVRHINQNLWDCGVSFFPFL